MCTSFLELLKQKSHRLGGLKNGNLLPAALEEEV